MTDLETLLILKDMNEAMRHANNCLFSMLVTMAAMIAWMVCAYLAMRQQEKIVDHLQKRIEALEKRAQ